MLPPEELPQPGHAEEEGDEAEADPAGVRWVALSPLGGGFLGFQNSKHAWKCQEHLGNHSTLSKLGAYCLCL